MKIEAADEPMKILGYAVVADRKPTRWREMQRTSSVVTGVMRLPQAKARHTALGGEPRGYRIVEVVEGATIHYSPEPR